MSDDSMQGTQPADFPDKLAALKDWIEYRDTDAFIDEIPAAYKPIDTVMRDSADLVKIRHKLRQLVNVKGD